LYLVYYIKITDHSQEKPPFFLEKEGEIRREIVFRGTDRHKIWNGLGRRRKKEVFGKNDG